MSDKTQLSEEEIDKIVISQAEDGAAWEDTIEVKTRETAVSLSPEMAKRAAFFAKLHHKSTAEEWLQTIIQERIQFEEAAFSTIKQAMRELLLKVW